LAGAPGNEILRDTLNVILHYYQVQERKSQKAKEGETFSLTSWWNVGSPGNEKQDSSVNHDKKQSPKFAASHMPNIDDTMETLEAKKDLMGPFTLEAAFKYHLMKRAGKEGVSEPSNSNDDEEDDYNQGNLQEVEAWQELEEMSSATESALNTELLKEASFNPNSYERERYFPNLKYQDAGTGCCCNYVVYRLFPQRQAYFFSRMIGARETCDYPKGKGPRLPPTEWSERKNVIPITEGIEYIHFNPSTASVSSGPQSA